MNAKLMTAALLAVVVMGGGFYALAADDSAADIDLSGDEYPIDHPGQVNMSNLFVILCIIFVIAALFCVGLAVYVKLYGDF